MMYSKILIIVLIVSNIGCVLTRTQIKNKEEKAEFSNKLTVLQRKNADDEAKFQEVESQVRELLGQSEILDKKISDAKLEKEKSTKLSLEKFKIYEEAILKVEKESFQIKNDISELKGLVLGLAKEIEALKKSKPKKSRVEKVPKGNYKSAEYYFSRKKWKKAIKGYQKYREMNPKGKRYKVSTYKIGVCFEELGLRKEAKLFYDEVIEKFSSSREAKKAKLRLKKLKKA